MKPLLHILLALGLTGLAGAQTQAIKNGKLVSTLDANTQDITALDQVAFGAGTPTSRIHIRPGAAPTAPSDGIRLGDDVVLYRSSANTLALTGNLVVSGTLQGGGGSSVTLAGNHTWTGTNQFSNTVTLSSTVNVSNSGLTFTPTGATATRTALGLVPGTDIQAYDADLSAIAALAKTDGNLIVANGSAWVVESGPTARTSLGLGTADTVTFDTLTATTSLSGAAATLSGQLSLPGATGGAGALLLGTTTELYESPAGTVRSPDNLRIDGASQLGSDGTDDTIVTGALKLGTSNDVSLERTGAGEVTLTGNLITTGDFTFGGQLSAASGGTGMDNSALAASRYLYTTGVGTFGSATITSDARDLLDEVDLSAMLTKLGGQAADGDLTTIAALSKTKGNLMAANGSAWIAQGVGTDGYVLLADSTQTAGVRWGDLSLSSTINNATLTGTVDASASTGFELPNGASPTTNAFGEVAGDDNAWATGRGALQAYDGTANTYLVGTLQADTPTNGQVPTWNTGGTITWETPSLPSTINDLVMTGDADASGATSFELPNGAAPTTSAFGRVAGDSNAWTTGRGAIQAYDGTANTFLVGALASDTPTNGQVPTWNTGGTITWESIFSDSATLAGQLSDETGSGGGFVRATSPTLTTVTIGGTGTTAALTLSGISGNPSSPVAGNLWYDSTANQIKTYVGGLIRPIGGGYFGYLRFRAGDWSAHDATPTDSTDTNNGRYTAFVDGVDSSVILNFVTPHNIRSGVTIKAKILWSTSASGSVTAVLGVNNAVKEGLALTTAPTSYGAGQEVNAGSSSASTLVMTSSISLGNTPTTPGEAHVLEIWRNGNAANDNAAADVRIYEVILQYEIHQSSSTGW